MEMVRTLSAHQTESGSVTTDDAPNNVLRMEIPLGVIIITTYIVLGHCVNQGEAQPEEKDQDTGHDIYMAKTENSAMGWWHCLVSPFH